MRKGIGIQDGKLIYPHASGIARTDAVSFHHDAPVLEPHPQVKPLADSAQSLFLRRAIRDCLGNRRRSVATIKSVKRQGWASPGVSVARQNTPTLAALE